jgi:hypothetical protein
MVRKEPPTPQHPRQQGSVGLLHQDMPSGLMLSYATNPNRTGLSLFQRVIRLGQEAMFELYRNRPISKAKSSRGSAIYWDSEVEQ